MELDDIQPTLGSGAGAIGISEGGVTGSSGGITRVPPDRFDTVGTGGFSSGMTDSVGDEAGKTALISAWAAAASGAGADTGAAIVEGSTGGFSVPQCSHIQTDLPELSVYCLQLLQETGGTGSIYTIYIALT